LLGASGGDGALRTGLDNRSRLASFYARQNTEGHCGTAEGKDKRKEYSTRHGFEFLSGLGPIGEAMSIGASQCHIDGSLGLIDSPYLTKLVREIVQVVAIVVRVARCKRAHHRKQSLEIGDRSAVVPVQGANEG